MTSRILIVEDNHDLAYGLKSNLEYEGYDVQVAETGTEAIEMGRDSEPDLMILDLMLPEVDGMKVLSTLRKEGSRMPVLILTARGEETDKVLGFRTGADDYVTKPFGLMELIARVNALLRRSQEAGHASSNGSGGADVGGHIAFGDVEIEVASRRVTKAGEEVALTPKEFGLLLALLERNGAVCSREELLHEVWNHQAPVPSRTVDTHVAELRKKLEDEPANPHHILTVWKYGYRFRA